MAAFFNAQIDYIFFCYGLAFILFVPICHFLNRRPRRRLPWMWLGLFGAAHGLNEWLDLLALDFGGGPAFGLARVTLLIVSFVFLVEFGRASTLTLRGRGPGRLILAVLLVVTALGGLAGFAGLWPASRYALGLVGGLWAAGALYLASRDPGPGKLALQGAALGMAAYALASGLVVNPAPFFPASLLNATTFFTATGLPIQLVRGLLALWICACLGFLAQAHLAQETERRIALWGKTLIFGAAAAVIALLLGGWFTTQYFGNDATRDIRINQESHGKVLYRAMIDGMEETDHLASTMAGSLQIPPALDSSDVKAIEKANLVLDRYSQILPGAVCYLMNLDGLTVASSNRQQPDSFVGKSYKFRPYFQQAVKGIPGRYWALGVTSKEMGYYASCPVRDRSGQTVGVAVFKRTVGEVKKFFPVQSLGFVSDAQGIVVMANRPDLVLQSLWPLTPALREQVLASRQFGTGPFPPILAREPLDRGEAWFQGKRLLVLRQPFPWEDWSMVILSPVCPVILGRFMGLAVTLTVCLGVIAFLTILGLTIDSTARIQTSERQYRGLYESLRDGSAAVDLKGKIVEFNHEFQEMLGYPAAELYQLTYQDLTPEAWQAVDARIVEEQIFPRGYSDLYEKEYRRHDGSVFPAEVRAYLIRDNQGRATGMWALVRDISERKKAEEALRETTEALQALIQASPLAIFVLDPEGRVQLWNEAAQRIFGWTAEEAVGQVLPIVPEEKLPEFRGLLQQALDGQPLSGVEVRRRTKDGRPIDVRTYTATLYDPQGRVTGVMALIADITLQKQAEEALKRSEATLKGIFMAAPIGIGLVSNRILAWTNEQVTRMTGYTAEELQGQSTRMLYQSDEEFERVGRVKYGELKERGTGTVETRWQRKDGGIIDILLSSTPIDPAQPTREVIFTALDITGRKRAEAALAEEAIRRRILVEQSRDGIVVLDQAGKVYEANQRYAEMLGYSAEEVRQLYVWDWDSQFTREQLEEMIRLSDAAGDHFETRHRRKDGTLLDVEISANGAVVAGQKLVFCVCRDISLRKAAERALQQSEEKYRLVFDKAPLGIMHYDQTGIITDCNEKFAEIIGAPKEDFIGFNMMRQLQDDQMREAVAASLKGEVGYYEGDYLSVTAGKLTPVRAICQPIFSSDGVLSGGVTIFEDISERKRAELERLQFSKLESLGTLAGGIAHDFNNILTAILGNIGLAMLEAQNEDRCRERLVEAERACLQAQNLARQLLTFAKGGAPVKEPLAVEKLISEAASFSCRGSQVRCEFTFPEDLWALEADPGQINQVFQNLVINAIQAMPTGGTINIRGENLEVAAGSDLPLSPGRYLKLSVRDHGAGMPNAYLPKIFDPYFTTKQKGSGLGLATVYSIIKNHHGHISVESKLGEGTVFNIYLPASGKKMVPAPEEGQGLLAGNGKILVMDDEEMVRQVLAKSLEKLGYEVMLAKDGVEAIESFSQAKESGEPFVAVILDLTIPGGMGGQEAMARLLKIDPHLKAIVSSGYSDDSIMAEFEKYGFRGVITKPYRITELSKVLSMVISGEQ
jgi:PAS domain S-box-containing protein